jgi:hypothetical protein
MGWLANPVDNHLATPDWPRAKPPPKKKKNFFCPWGWFGFGHPKVVNKGVQPPYGVANHPIFLKFYYYFYYFIILLFFKCK